MKRLMAMCVAMCLLLGLLGCSGYGMLRHGSFTVYLEDGTTFYNVKWYKSRTEGIGPAETPTGTVMFLTEEYGIVEVPWDNVLRIQSEPPSR